MTPFLASPNSPRPRSRPKWGRRNRTSDPFLETGAWSSHLGLRAGAQPGYRVARQARQDRRDRSGVRGALLFASFLRNAHAGRRLAPLRSQDQATGGANQYHLQDPCK
jgi:hypothetical protein